MCINIHTQTHTPTNTHVFIHICTMQCSINSLTLSFMCRRFMISILENMNHKNTNTHALKTHQDLYMKVHTKKVFIYKFDVVFINVLSWPKKGKPCAVLASSICVLFWRGGQKYWVFLVNFGEMFGRKKGKCIGLIFWGKPVESWHTLVGCKTQFYQLTKHTTRKRWKCFVINFSWFFISFFFLQAKVSL